MWLPDSVIRTVDYPNYRWSQLVRTIDVLPCLHLIQDRWTEQINTCRRANESHKKPVTRHVIDLTGACPVTTIPSVREIKWSNIELQALKVAERL